MSCKDDAPVLSDTGGGEDSDKVKVSFLMPDPGFESRVYDETKEGYMSNLYVVAIQTSTYEYQKDESGNYVLDENGKYIFDKATPTPEASAFNVFKLDATGNKIIVGSNEYQDYEINLYPGKYRFYLLANIDLYLGRTNTVYNFTSEEQVKYIVMNYKADTPITPGHLPMACLPKDIKYGQTETDAVGFPDTDTDYTVSIDKDNENRIFAEMELLCSKVRVTILFNRKTISKEFGEKNTIRFYADDNNLPYATNLREKNRLDRSISKDAFDAYQRSLTDYQGTLFDYSFIVGQWTFTMGRYYYPGTYNSDGTVSPENCNDNYPSSPTDELVPWDKTVMEWINDNKDQRAWQTVIYLPENDVDDTHRTILNFPYIYNGGSLEQAKDQDGHPLFDDDGNPIYTGRTEKSGEKMIYLFGGNNNGQHYGYSGDSYQEKNNDDLNEEGKSTHGLTRGYMYDVVAKVKTPDALDINVYVTVKPWLKEDHADTW